MSVSSPCVRSLVVAGWLFAFGAGGCVSVERKAPDDVDAGADDGAERDATAGADADADVGADALGDVSAGVDLESLPGDTADLEIADDGADADACASSCGTKVCGPDGCGGSCGSCDAGEDCDAGLCVCRPDCAGKTCGADGCGGSCGSCGSEQVCGASDQCAAACPVGWRLIPAGSFMMGSPLGELGRGDDEPQHAVTLTRSFCMQATEVTQAQWLEHMGNNPSGSSSCGPNCPIMRVNWWEALAYANALSAKEGLSPCYALTGCTVGALPGDGWKCTSVQVDAPEGNPYLCAGYRLPTEAEWEYAARAGTTTAFYNGAITNPESHDPNADAIGWYVSNADYTAHPVQQKAPNAWGLYDMSGNVVEWCWDWYGAYSIPAPPDPLGPPYGSSRVVRSGLAFSLASDLRSAARFSQSPSHRVGFPGFRCVRSLP